MRVFVLGTGRCGTVTFFKACEHITNYTCSHESDRKVTRDYPDKHIEIDNRVVWIRNQIWREGTLRRRDYYFLWLRRNREDTIESFMRLGNSPIILCWWAGILQQKPEESRRREAVESYVDMVESELLHESLIDRYVWIENPEESFTRFWGEIKAEGDLRAALDEFKTRHNDFQNKLKRRISSSVSSSDEHSSTLLQPPASLGNPPE